MAPNRQERASYIVIALGSNVHIFARPHRRGELAAVLRAALDAELTEVKHPGHPYYFMIPGGQVFTIAPTS